MEKKTVIRKNPNMVTRVIADETVLLPIYKTSEEINCIYTLNKVASRVWELFDGRRDVAEIERRILKEFDSTPVEVDRELNKLLKELEEIKAISH